MLSRRSFLQAVGTASVAAAAHVPARGAAARLREGLPVLSQDPEEVARDEAFWDQVRREYSPSAHFINLESGYYSATADPVTDAMCGNVRRLNELHSFYLRKRMSGERQAVKERLARFAGVSVDEIVITRNTTESLNAVILGLDLVAGDEALMCEREYPNMQSAFDQRRRRDGIVVKKIEVPWTPQAPAEVVRCYEQAITPKTKVILVSHVIFLTGQVMPVRAIADMAHARGIEVIVDAAHSFAHLDYKIPELGADYLGTSLHKWLGAPIGAGLLYIRKEKIPRVWPLFGSTNDADDITKFENYGTHPMSTVLAIVDAIRFHETIGGKRKEARLRYLKNTWAEAVKDVPGVTVNTPLDPRQSCAITAFDIEGHTPRELWDLLYDRYGIFTVGPRCGVRVSPNLHNTLDDVRALVAAIREIAG